MPSPKSGKAGTLVAPIKPAEPAEAATAEAGAVEEATAATASGEAGSFTPVNAPPFTPPTEEEAEEAQELSWIEIELVGMDDKPIPGERYRVLLPDGRADEGTLDQNGWARIAGFEAGQCTIEFPELDQDAWEFIESAGPRTEQ